MKKIILIILILLLIPFFIITIKDIDREEVNPTLTYNLTTTDSTYTDLNDHTLQEVFEDESRLIGIGKNLFDGNLQFIGGLTSLGVVDNVATRRTTSYIRVKPSTTYIWKHFNGVNIYRVAGYSDKSETSFNQNISNSDSMSTISFTTNSDVNYVRIGLQTTTDNLGQLELGSTATAYEAYKSTENNDSTPFVNWFNQSNFGLESLSSSDLDAWYTIYQTYHNSYTTLTLGTATPTTYTSLQQLILDNDDKDFKLYRDDVVDESHYRLTQESGYISITNDDDLEIMRINDDDTFESSLQIDDTIDYKIVGYNVTSYIDGSFDNTILAFVWIIPILLIGGFFFVIFSHRKED